MDGSGAVEKKPLDILLSQDLEPDSEGGKFDSRKVVTSLGEPIVGRGGQKPRHHTQDLGQRRATTEEHQEQFILTPNAEFLDDGAKSVTKPNVKIEKSDDVRRKSSEVTEAALAEKLSFVDKHKGKIASISGFVMTMLGCAALPFSAPLLGLGMGLYFLGLADVMAGNNVSEGSPPPPVPPKGKNEGDGKTPREGTVPKGSDGQFSAQINPNEATGSKPDNDAQSTEAHLNKKDKEAAELRELGRQLVSPEQENLLADDSNRPLSFRLAEALGQFLERADIDCSDDSPEWEAINTMIGVVERAVVAPDVDVDECKAAMYKGSTAFLENLQRGGWDMSGLATLKVNAEKLLGLPDLPVAANKVIEMFIQTIDDWHIRNQGE